MSDPTGPGEYGTKTSKAIEIGSPSGLYILPISFTYATVGLENGAPLYTPNVGDILYDAWFSITTAWNEAAVGDFNTGGSNGLFNASSGDIDFTAADEGATANPSLLVSGSNKTLLMASYSDGDNREVAPATFLTDAPINVVVSQNGLPGGGATGATAGAATLYLVLATPA